MVSYLLTGTEHSKSRKGPGNYGPNCEGTRVFRVWHENKTYVSISMLILIIFSYEQEVPNTGKCPIFSTVCMCVCVYVCPDR